MKNQVSVFILFLMVVCCTGFAQDLSYEYEMILITPGSFLMGSDDGLWDEWPLHQVNIGAGFWLGKYEVTQALWKAVMGHNPSYSPGCPECPVEQISWSDAQQFVQVLNALTGESYRLPTEAEYEFAARAGTTTEYYWGAALADVDDYAWNRENCNSTQPVGSKLPNAWGLFDMTGNVWEWCQDWYDGDYYSISPVNDPGGPEIGETKVIRGGSWASGLNNMRVARRYPLLPDEWNYWTGLRLAKDEFICEYGPADDPMTFTRQKGRPFSETIEWDSCGGSGVLEILNDGVSSAEIFLNNEMIVGPGSLNQHVEVLEINVDLLEEPNILEVELRGKPGRSLSISFDPLEP